MQGEGHVAHCGIKGVTRAIGGLTLQRPKEDGQEAVAEGKNSGAVDLKRNLKVGGSEDGTGTDTCRKPARMKDVNKTFPISTEVGQEMQG